MLISIFLILAGIIALLFVLALFTKKEYNIHREIIINAPLQPVFDYIKYFRNWDSFNKRATADPEKDTEYRGTDGTVGFIIAWNGNKKVGEGEKEIKAIEEGKKIDTEIRFVRPFEAIGHTSMTTEALSTTQTTVTLSNSSKIKYPFNILLLVVKKGIAKDMDESLTALKNIIEK